MKEKIDIIFVYWKTDIFVKKCVEQYLKTKFDNFNIYIVDNTRKSKDKLESYFNSEKVHVIPGAKYKEKMSDNQAGRHHPRGLEEGLKRTSSKYVAISHCDCWPIDVNWAEKCLGYLHGDRIKMVGLQHSSSLHASFHFFKREMLTDINYRYDKKKMSFGDNKSKLKKYVKYPEVVKPSRTRWDWGENLAIKLYKEKYSTIGINPTKGFAPYGRYKNKKYNHEPNTWENLGQDGYGCVYGDMFFHVWKTYRKNEEVNKYMKMYEQDEYMNRYYHTNEECDNIVVNNSVHDNSYYKFFNNFKYKEDNCV